MMEYYGVLAAWSEVGSVFIALFCALFMGFFAAPLFLWSLAILGFLWLMAAPMGLIITLGVILAVYNVPFVRQHLVSAVILRTLRALKFMPVISETERVAIEAGTTWVEGELFAGNPNFDRINKEKYSKMSAEEQAFIDGPVERICQMVSDWEVYKQGEIPADVWAAVKKEKLFGMIVPKKYGGLEFSAICQSEVVGKISSRCLPLGITVMVPNSLGPGELINHYGTQKQKDYYLPRLAVGEEIPCFALTETEAGSDAGSITSNGEIFKGEDGQLYVKLNWEKRYITLAAIATIVGLAIKLKDPQNLLGKGTDLGITCVLVPANTKGVVLGRRHNPMGVPFYNCPTRGENVVVSIDQIIGGKDGVGRGWQMLMECLAAGRAISLPAQSTAMCKLTARVTSAYCFIRRQFGMSIGKFEGVEEKLARIVGLTYMAEAARIFTCGAVDSGVKPSVVSAIAKYNMTELGRLIINDGMDILGGAAISRGPRNVIANAYIAGPIGITVEGANILTRTMIIFGQGAIRCHPYAYKELKAIGDNNLKDFDRAFWSHIGFVIRNVCRATLLSLTRGWLASVPSGVTAKYYRRIAWSSACFAVLADVAMGSFGGSLKAKEKITGRFADILIWMYYMTATLRRFREEGEKKEHRAVLKWSMEYALTRIQEGFEGIFDNFDVPVIKQVLRGPIGFWSRLNRLSTTPQDTLGRKIARRIMKPGAFRDDISSGIFNPSAESDPASILERSFKIIYAADTSLKKITAAVKEKKLPKDRPIKLVDKAVAQGIITQAEADVIRNAEKARYDAVSVDSFDLAEFSPNLLESKKRA